jgi:hypothetical protein
MATDHSPPNAISRTRFRAEPAIPSSSTQRSQVCDVTSTDVPIGSVYAREPSCPPDQARSEGSNLIVAGIVLQFNEAEGLKRRRDVVAYPAPGF